MALPHSRPRHLARTSLHRTGRHCCRHVAPAAGFAPGLLRHGGNVAGVFGQGLIKTPVPLGAVGVPQRGRIVQQRFHITTFARCGCTVCANRQGNFA